MGGSMPVNRCFPRFVMRLHPWAVTLPDLKRPPSLHAQAPQRRLKPRVPLLRAHSATTRSATAVAPTTLPSVMPLSIPPPGLSLTTQSRQSTSQPKAAQRIHAPHRRAWRRHTHVTTPPVPATHAPPARVEGMVREKSRRLVAHGLNRNGNDAAHRRKFGRTARSHMTRRSARLIQTARRKPLSPCGSGFLLCCL